MTGGGCSSGKAYKHDNSVATTQYHRTSLEDGGAGTQQQMYAPRVDLVDGTEPEINALLGK